MDLCRSTQCSMSQSKDMRLSARLDETSGSVEPGSASTGQLPWVPYCLRVKMKVGHQAGR